MEPYIQFRAEAGLAHRLGGLKHFKLEQQAPEQWELRTRPFTNIVARNNALAKASQAWSKELSVAPEEKLDEALLAKLQLRWRQDDQGKEGVE